MRKKIYLEAKKCSKFHRRATVRDSSSHWSESLSLPTTLAVTLSAVALPIVPKVDFNFEVLLCITILVCLSPGSCSRSTISYQNSISKPTPHTDRHVIRGCWSKENDSSAERFERTLHCLIFQEVRCTFSITDENKLRAKGWRKSC